MSASATNIHVYQTASQKSCELANNVFRDQIGNAADAAKMVYESIATDVWFNWRQYRDMPKDFERIWQNVSSEMFRLAQENDWNVSNKVIDDYNDQAKKALYFDCSMKLAQKSNPTLKKTRMLCVKEWGKFNPELMDKAYSIIQKAEKAAREAANAASKQGIQEENSKIDAVAKLADLPVDERVATENESIKANANFNFDPDRKKEKADLKIHDAIYSLPNITSRSDLIETWDSGREIFAAFLSQRNNAMIEAMEAAGGKYSKQAKLVRQLFFGK